MSGLFCPRPSVRAKIPGLPLTNLGDSPEIPETPTVTSDNVRCEGDDQGDGSSAPLDKYDPAWEIQASNGASTIAGDRVLEIKGGEPSI